MLPWSSALVVSRWAEKRKSWTSEKRAKAEKGSTKERQARLCREQGVTPRFVEHCPSVIPFGAMMRYGLGRHHFDLHPV